MNENLYKHFIISTGEEKKVPCGDRLFRYYKGDVLRTPFPLKPASSITCNGRISPVLQQYREQIIAALRKRYERFPDCCEWHKNLRKISGFDKKDYIDAHVQCADSIIFCYAFITYHQNFEDYRRKIESYLQLAVFRFGCMPSGCGSALFLDTFDELLRNLVKQSSEIKPDVKHFVLSILNKYITPSVKDQIDPIEELLRIYNNWLNAFPFDFPEFQTLKKEFASKSPLMVVRVQNEVNHGDSYFRLETNKELVEWLNKTSKELLKRLQDLSLVTSILLNRYESTVEKKQLDIKEAKLLDCYSEEENAYIKTLEDWYKIQLERIAVIRKTLPKIEGEEAVTSFKEACRRLDCFKLWIENQDGCKLLRDIKDLNETHIQLLFKSLCTMSSSSFCFDREVNNGRGPVDFLVSKGSEDRTILEFKLGSNKELEYNLQYQVDVYQRANESSKVILAVFCLNEQELKKTEKLFLKYRPQDNCIRYIIDCRSYKPSASKVRKDEEL